MADVSRTGSAIVHPSNQYDMQSFEMGKFSITNGTVSINTTTVGGAASGYPEGTTVGTITGGALVFRDSAGTLRTVQSGGSGFPVNLDGLIAGENLTKDVLGQIQKPVNSATYAPTQHTNFGAAAGTGVIIATVPTNVYAFDVTSATTALRYFQLFNQGTVPVVGQTPIASYELGSVTAGQTYRLQVSSTDLSPSLYFSTGLAAAISSTKGTLGTASITAADYSWHIKYM